MSRVRLLAVLAVLLGVLTPLSGSAATCTRADAGDSWQRWTAPPDLAEGIRSMAVAPAEAARVWVTDGEKVLRTVDAGCEWRVAFEGGGGGVDIGVNVNGGLDGITQVLTTGPLGRETTWVVDQGIAAVGARRSQVFVATGGGDSFTEVLGLPPVGDVVLAVGLVPTRAYAVVTAYENVITTGEDQQALVSTLYVTSDTGTTWRRVGDLPDGFAPVGAGVTPTGEYLTWSRTQLLRSSDGGVPKPVAVTAADGIVDVSVGRTVAVVPGKGPAQVSTDGGVTFTARPLPAGTHEISEIPGTAAYALIVGTRSPRVVVWSPGLPTLDVTPRLTKLVGLAGGRSGSGVPVVVGHGAKAVLALPLTPEARPVTPPLPLPPLDVTIKTPGVRAPPVSALVPASTLLTLQPGERRRVSYRLSLPPVPGPLDVYFLMDTTASMDPSIRGLKESIQEIVDSLAATRLDVQIGLGDFRDVDHAADGYVYRRDARIAPPGEALARGLRQLTTSGGVDAPEADTIALVEAVTGKGRPGLVEAGQDAGFRPDSTQVIVLVTDAPMHTQSPVYPTFEEVKDTLGQVRVLGIAVGSDGLADLQRVAGDTEGTAPPEGIDCEGDGTLDIVGGAPAVCQVSEGGFGAQQLGPAIISLLQGVAQPGRVTVSAKGPAVAGVVGAVDSVLDLARPQQLGFSVDFACGTEDAGRELTADLAATASGRRVIGSVAKVRCAALPVPPKPAPAPAPPRPNPVAVALVPPAAPPAPAQAPQAQPVTNPQPGTVTNPNVMAAAVDQHQEQFELALAQQEIEAFEELAMVGRPGVDDQAAALRVLAAAAVFASVCGGVRLRSRRVAKRSLAKVRA